MKTHKNKNRGKGKNWFEDFASKATKATGSNYAFIIACSVVILWLVSGPIFGYSDTWQLVINTGTTIVTFLMVFLIQKTQNKDGIAMQVKLNELVSADRNASDRIIDVEDLTEDELEYLEKYYRKLAQHTKRQHDLKTSHSIDNIGKKTEQPVPRQKKRIPPKPKPRVVVKRNKPDMGMM
jgi:low affinity Fe/Cu permease